MSLGRRGTPGEPHGSSHRGGGRGSRLPRPHHTGHGVPAWPLPRAGSGASCRGVLGLSHPRCRQVGCFYYPCRFLSTDGLKFAVAIFRRMISYQFGSRLLATEMDGTTAGASERSGRWNSCCLLSPHTSLVSGQFECRSSANPRAPQPPWGARFAGDPQPLQSPLTHSRVGRLLRAGRLSFALWPLTRSSTSPIIMAT